MRTTVDLPDDLHGLARELAHQQKKTFSEVITDLIRLGLRPDPGPPGPRERGLPRLRVGRLVTAEDVRDLEDET
jgi:hypothetical protein